MFEHFTFVHYLHVIGLILLFIVVAVRSRTLFTQFTDDGQPCQQYRALYVACQHSSLTLIGATGIYLLYQHAFNVQNWFYAKIILFAVMLSSLIKAFKKPRADLTLQHRKAGLAIALFCYLSIFLLIFVSKYA